MFPVVGSYSSALAKKVREQVKTPITAIVSPAVGGIVPGYEMGRQLGLPAMYVERVDGVFQLRRNFALKKGQPVLMVEDIVSTGVSSRECIAAIKKTGAKGGKTAALKMTKAERTARANDFS